MAGKFVDVTLRLIDKMSEPLKKAQGKLVDSANQWSKAGRQIEKAGKNIAATGSSLTKAVTVPVAGLGAAAIKVAADFEQGMDKVSSITGQVSSNDLSTLEKTAQEMGLSWQQGTNDTETAMNILAEKAKQMGASTKFSATEAADAYSYMAMAGWKAGDMAQGIEGIMYLAGATGEDLASTSDIVTDSLTAFGMSAADTNDFVDILAATANNANTNVNMLGESFKYVAPVAGSLKYNAEDVSVALGLMANNGIKASQAGTSMRSWLSRMAAPTEAVQSAMDKLGISLTDSEGNMKSLDTIMRETRAGFAGLSEAEASATASALAGKSGMSGLLAIVNSSDGDFEKLSKAIYESDGACKTMYDTANDNLQGQLTILKSTVESIGISFGQRMTPYIKQATEWIQNLADRFNSLSPEQQDMIIKIGLVAAAVGPALLVFGKMTSTVGHVIKTVGTFGKALKVAGSVMGLITSPVGITILVLGALIAAGVLVVKNWDKIKEAAGKVFGYVGNALSNVGISGDSLKEKLGSIWKKVQTIGANLKELWNSVIKPTLGEFISTASAVLGPLLKGAIDVAIGVLGVLAEKTLGVIDGLLGAFGGLIKFVTGVFTGDWQKAWDGVKEIFGGAFNALVALFKEPMNVVIGLINSAIEKVNGLGIKIPDWVPVLGGKDFSINIPKIPALAIGTQNWGGGLAQISEKGGEIVDLPRGSRVYPHDESVKKAYNEGQRRGAASVVIAKLADQIIVREEADIDRIAEKLAEKLEKVSQNLGDEDIGYSY